SYTDKTDSNSCRQQGRIGSSDDEADSRRKDVARWAIVSGKSSWMLVSPMPILLERMRLPDSWFSISTPPILRSWIYRSFGHLTVAPATCPANLCCIPIQIAMFRLNVWAIVMFLGYRTKLTMRFWPGWLMQVLPLCPLPQAWWFAIMAVASGSGLIFHNSSFK